MHLGIQESFDLDFLGEGHAVGFKLHVFQNATAENPHAGLRIRHPTEEQQRHSKRQDQIANLVLEAHRLGVADREARRVQKVGFEVKKRLQ